eukprot:Clim_evm64s199 gene=Clim_evmTU64s199
MLKYILAVIVAMAGTEAAAARDATPQHDDGGYIQFNGSPYRTNVGQRVHIVTQFGNKGDSVLENVGIECSYPKAMGDTGDIQNHPPFPEVQKSTSFFGGQRRVSAKSIDVNPGQNYNFGFQILIPNDAVPGSSFEVTCKLCEDHWLFGCVKLDWASADVNIFQ